MTSPAPARDEPRGEKRIVGYFAEWSGANAAELPAEQLTHVIYAFAQIKDGQVALIDGRVAVEHFRQLASLREKRSLKMLISIGGWGSSSPFSDTALTTESRDKFARSCAAFSAKHGMDGIDIDWEFPGGGGKDPDAGRPEDKRNFTLLLESMRAALDEQAARDGKQYLLTFAAPAGAHHYQHIELDQVHRFVDWINLMTYDMAGNWSRATAFNAPLFAPDSNDSRTTTRRAQLSVDDSVRAYLSAGVPKDKLVVGVPFYGRAFGGVKDVNHGLGQPHDPAALPKTFAAREWTFRNISAKHAGPTGHRFWHDVAKVPWLYDSATGVFVTYDDADSIRAKAEYVRDNNLGGVMIWEMSHDDQQHTLVRTIHSALHGKK